MYEISFSLQLNVFNQQQQILRMQYQKKLAKQPFIYQGLIFLIYFPLSSLDKTFLFNFQHGCMI